MTKIMLDKEQMDNLKKLGVDTSKAQIEGFTISELLEMIPDNPYEGKTEFDFNFIVSKKKVGWFNGEKAVLSIIGGEIIDRVYSLLVHGIERGYIKTNKE